MAWCCGDRRGVGRGGDWKSATPLWWKWKGAAAEMMDPEGFWFACLLAPLLSCTILQGLFGDSDRLASDIDTWHAPRAFVQRFFFFFVDGLLLLSYNSRWLFHLYAGFFFNVDLMEGKQEHHLIRFFGDCGGGGDSSGLSILPSRQPSYH